MAIRVTQQTMYNTMLSGMQSNLAAYMESVEQGSSQKKINRPSDDPAGTYRVLTTRVDISNTAQYKENVDTAKGWLTLADDVLSNQASVAIQGLTSLAEQASTGTYSAEQREIMAQQAKQFMGQLLNLSNTRFEGKTIFAGHKYSEAAFEMGLGITSWDENFSKLWNEGGINITGSTDKTVLVQFTADGQVATDTTYRWSNDGGASWQNGKVTEKDGILELDTNGIITSFAAANSPVVKKSSGSANAGANDGTMFYIRPAAVYQGDDEDPPAQITVMGDPALKKDKIETQGDFGKDVIVRFEEIKNGELKYGYSTDNGATWSSPRSAQMPQAGVSLRIPVPGGYMDIKPEDNVSQVALTAGSQVMIHPSRSDLDYEIMKDTYLSVNSVGKEVFGGVYNNKPALANDEDNLFEIVGKFIGYLEGNNQQGCQQTLAQLKTAEKKLLAEATRIGGMENRLSMAEDVLEFQKLDQEDRLSYTEDIDLTELLQKLTRQQISYQTVLQSSLKIMQMNLASYL